MPDEDDIIKPEDISDGEIEAIADMAEEEEDSYDFLDTAFYMIDTYDKLSSIDTSLFNASEKARLEKAKNQSLKLVCHCINEVHDSYFPKNIK